MEEIRDILDLWQPDSCSAQERRELRVAQENEKFDLEHYMYVLLLHGYLQTQDGLYG